MPRPWIPYGLCVLAIIATSLVRATSFVLVDSTADLPDADVTDGVCRTVQNTCTLRAAIMQANWSSDDRPIVLPPATLHLSIAPSGSVEDDASGDLDIITSFAHIEIIGAGASGTGQSIVDAGGLDRAFHVIAGAWLTLSYVSVTNGNSDTYGGCIYDEGNLTLIESDIGGCMGNYGGGAIDITGSADLHGSHIHDSFAGAGGGIENSGLLALIDSIVERNASSRGGGLYADPGASTSLLGSAIVGNSGGDGGGIATYGSLTAVNTTVAGNAASGNGGGLAVEVENASSTRLYNVSVVYNAADNDGDGVGSGAGLWVETIATDGSSVTVANTLVADNVLPGERASNDCVGALVAQGGNRLGSQPYCDEKGCLPTGVESCAISGSSDLLNSIDLLGPIADSGARTPTVALLPGSNAIDAGDPGGCVNDIGQVLTYDQRYYNRPAGAACDVGAYESGAINPIDAIFANGFN